MTNPLVSICVPTYNGEEFLQEALDSVKAQTYKHIEVIISDDASKDRTLEICESFKNEVDFPVYIYHHEPTGIGANWNYSIEKANGEYIKFLFQDDIMKPDCLQKMLDVLLTNKKVQLVSSKRGFINNFSDLNGEEIIDWLKKYGNLQQQFEDENLKNQDYYIIDKSLFKRNDFFTSPPNKIGEPSVVMFRKNVFCKIGPFNNNLKQILDYEYWYRVLSKYDIAIINEELVNFRLHENQETNINRNRIINDYELYERFQYKKLLYYVNLTRKKYLLRKYNKTYKFFLSIYYKIRYS